MNEKLICGCKSTGCHFCEADEVYATMKYEDAEGGTCCIHICGECQEEIIRNKLSDKAKKELGWRDDVD